MNSRLISDLPPVWIPAVAVALGVCGTLLLLWRYRVLKETTLLAAWWWSLVSLIAISGTSLVLHLPSLPLSSAWRAPLQFAAAATIFCPVIATLGAKRPQHHAWQLIVFSLWLILILPALENALLNPDQPLDIRDSRAWFLVALIFISGVNWLPTRFWFGSLLMTAAQIVLLSPYLPIRIPDWQINRDLTGLGLAVGAVTVAAFRAKTSRPSARGIDRLWFEFRDLYGVMWALRFAERVNTLASSQNAAAVLHWSGVQRAANTETETTTSTAADGENTEIDNLIRSMLRRFVSTKWIEDQSR